MGFLHSRKQKYGNMVELGFKIELTHPGVHCLVGFQKWDADDEQPYNTFKLHFLWITLRWDWE